MVHEVREGRMKWSEGQTVAFFELDAGRRGFPDLAQAPADRSLVGVKLKPHRVDDRKRYRRGRNKALKRSAVWAAPKYDCRFASSTVPAQLMSRLRKTGTKKVASCGSGALTIPMIWKYAESAQAVRRA